MGLQLGTAWTNHGLIQNLPMSDQIGRLTTREDGVNTVHAKEEGTTQQRVPAVATSNTGMQVVLNGLQAEKFPVLRLRGSNGSLILQGRNASSQPRVHSTRIRN